MPSSNLALKKISPRAIGNPLIKSQCHYLFYLKSQRNTKLTDVRANASTKPTLPK